MVARLLIGVVRVVVAPALVLVASLFGCTVEPPAADTWRWKLPAHFPTPNVPADNPMTADKVELGRHLFYDTRLSRDGSQSCATCHDQARAFSDGNTTPIGVTGEAGVHNAMSLANVAYNSSSTWAKHVTRLEDQALLPMLGTTPIEMGVAGHEAEVLARLRDESLYADLFPRVFDARGADRDADPFTLANVTRAIASFERTILSGDSRFDRFVAGDRTAVTTSEQRGLDLFESDRLGCMNCHGGFNLASAYEHVGASQVQFFNTGLYNVDGHGAYPAHDRGLVDTTGDASHMGRFRAPTLRNIALTAPYFHDGSAATLADVVDTYARGGRLLPDGPHAGDGALSPLKSTFITGFTLTTEERADLIAFLGALTDDSLVTRSSLANPW